MQHKVNRQNMKQVRHKKINEIGEFSQHALQCTHYYKHTESQTQLVRLARPLLDLSCLPSRVYIILNKRGRRFLTAKTGTRDEFKWQWNIKMLYTSCIQHYDDCCNMKSCESSCSIVSSL